MVLLSNSTPSGILSLSLIKDNMYNEETRRKNIYIDTSQTLVTLTESRDISKNKSIKRCNKSRGKS